MRGKTVRIYAMGCKTHRCFEKGIWRYYLCIAKGNQEAFYATERTAVGWKDQGDRSKDEYFY